MPRAVYHTFMSNGEFWVASHSIAKLRKVGTIVLDPDVCEEKFYLWDGKEWIAGPMEGLPVSIKTFLLIYSVPETIKAQIRNNLEREPIYLCNWR